MLQIDLQKHPLPLTLGSHSLQISSYQLKQDAPVIRHILCDGTVTQTVCGDAPCTLTVSGGAVYDESGTLLAALAAEMAAQTAFDFTFAGIAFEGMQLTSVNGKAGTGGITGLTLTLTGGIAG